MTFKYKLTKPIEKLDYRAWSLSWSMPDYLYNMLQQKSCLVQHTPNAFFEPIDKRFKDVWEYQLTDRHQLMLDIAGAQTHGLWFRLFSRTLYINRRWYYPKEDTV